MKVIFFSSSACRTCKMIRPVLSRLSRRYELEYEDFVIESNKEKFAEYGVMGTPTILVFDGEKKLGTIVGHQTETSLESKFKRLGVI